MAQYVRLRLAPAVENLKYVIRGTRQLVKKVEACDVPSECMLGSGGIRDFYPSTTPEMAARCIFISLQRLGASDALAVADMAFAILRHQYVSADGIPYRCKKVGQGLAFASEACDISADTLIESNDRVAPLLDGAILYGRFRGDVVVVLAGNISSGTHHESAAAFNACHSTYTAKFEWSDAAITALDFEISRHGSILTCKTRFKPTNLFRYLPTHSNHPGSVFSSWIRAELVRYIIT